MNTIGWYNCSCNSGLTGDGRKNCYGRHKLSCLMIGLSKIFFTMLPFKSLIRCRFVFHHSVSQLLIGLDKSYFLQQRQNVNFPYSVENFLEGFY